MRHAHHLSLLDTISPLLSSLFYSQNPPIISISSVPVCYKSMSPSHDLITDLASISTISDLYKASQLQPTAPDTPTPPPSSILNAKISLVRTSITTLAVTSIVNAANQSLLGGGGVVSAPQRRQLIFRVPSSPNSICLIVVLCSRTVQFTRPPAARFSLNAVL